MIATGPRVTRSRYSGEAISLLVPADGIAYSPGVSPAFLNSSWRRPSSETLEKSVLW